MQTNVPYVKSLLCTKYKSTIVSCFIYNLVLCHVWCIPKACHNFHYLQAAQCHNQTKSWNFMKRLLVLSIKYQRRLHEGF